MYRLIFQSLYHTSLISQKREIDETVNFRNIRKLLTNKFPAFFAVFWHPIFKREKRKEVTGYHEAYCNGRHLYCIEEVDVPAKKQ